jgi:two-component system, NarL family, sensor kinase
LTDDIRDDLAGNKRLLRQIIEVTAADLGLREVACRVAALVTGATTSDVCFVHLVDEERGRVFLAGATPPFDELVGTIELPLGEGVAGWVAAHGEPAVVPDKWADARYQYIPALRGEDYASLVSLPMMIRGRVVGVLNVHSKQPRSYEGDLVLLNDVASLMARTVENARLYHRLAEREEMLAGFAARTVEAQELERRRLAGEIHDGISQRLISLWYHLLAAEDGVDQPDLVRRELAVAKELATSALEETRTTIAGLRPSVLDDLGLGPSLESLARSLSGPAVELDLDSCRLSPHVEMALYRIAQEALQNVVKHADASVVTVRLTSEDGSVRLVVEDNGGGFNEAAIDGAHDRSRYGLVGMRERAELIGARLMVMSRPGEGTRVEVVVPEPLGPPLWV